MLKEENTNLISIFLLQYCLTRVCNLHFVKVDNSECLRSAMRLLTTSQRSLDTSSVEMSMVFRLAPEFHFRYETIAMENELLYMMEENMMEEEEYFLLW